MSVPDWIKLSERRLAQVDARQRAGWIVRSEKIGLEPLPLLSTGGEDHAPARACADQPTGEEREGREPLWRGSVDPVDDEELRGGRMVQEQLVQWMLQTERRRNLRERSR